MSERAPVSWAGRLVTLASIAAISFGFALSGIFWDTVAEGRGEFSFAVLGPRLGYYFALFLAVLILFGGLPWVRRRAGRKGEIVALWAIVFLVASHILLLFNRVEKLTDFQETLPILGAVAYVGLGGTVATLEPKSPFGLRLRWLLDSERAWTSAHRFLGVCFALGGIGCGVVGVLDSDLGFATVVAAPVVSMLAGVVYSLLFVRKPRVEASGDPERPM